MRVIQQLKSIPATASPGAGKLKLYYCSCIFKIVFLVGDELETDLSILEEVLRMLLEILNATFTHQLAGNPHLVYSLLHQREVLDILRRIPAFQDVVTNIDTVRPLV